MYTPEDIKNVLQNTFADCAERIELAGDNEGNYRYYVYPGPDVTLGELSSKAQELYDSDLFDVTMLRDKLEVEYLNPFVLERKQFAIVYESAGKWITFDDKQVANLKNHFSRLNVKYHSNTFFKSIMEQLETKKKLSKKQFDELLFLIKNGKTKYEAGVLSKKN